ncbi:MAG: molybdopterin-guanine dinucleotide biosynthesis protein B [Spirochaetes bacterium]|nr:molybdopterin-guanine dinucleotide biosynthesis protein B [Spirochaetota bacterium]
MKGPHGPERPAPLRAVVLTMSDRCLRGETVDTAGPAVARILEGRLSAAVAPIEILPDERAALSRRLIEVCDGGLADFVAVVGGTGFSPRDVTPEAVRDVAERLTPGLDEAMRAESLKKTPRAMLSRCVSGIRRQTLLVSLPGSERSAVENLEAILPALAHGIAKLQGDPADCGPPRGGGAAQPRAKGPFVLGICGYSGSGKSTLIEGLVPVFRGLDLRVAVVKHDAHAPSVDAPGKDSDRFFRAGADVWLRSPGENFSRRHGPGEDLGACLARLERDYDVILVEGHKDAPLPSKIWLRAEDGGDPPASAGLFLDCLGRGVDRQKRVLEIFEAWKFGIAVR